MQIVIDIPEKEYLRLKEPTALYWDSILYKAIANGKPYEERKTGKWYCDMYGVFRCDSCGKSAHLDSRGRAWLDRYCSWCGAKMEVEE